MSRGREADDPRPVGGEEDRNLEGSRVHELRMAIQELDGTLVSLVARRVRLAREIGDLKRVLGSGPLDPMQEAGVIRRAGELARENGLPEDDIRQVFWLLVGMSRHAQEKNP